ncbi:YhcH/YjgK/YiaL family protein [Pectinatus sottacetonis]|uniref:YhcH/YjgK/YiaL family protein n=1 Tax=Pectinatus sottacetonis TaxID=1002795 RepID=UPI0018C684CD|nr:YhcH/YjgK/YiaL family protein [Pectinatus sottacetonis]
MNIIIETLYFFAIYILVQQKFIKKWSDKMIFGNVLQLDEMNLPQKIMTCFQYYKNNALNERKTGTYEIDGRNIFVNIDEYETRYRQQCFWEAHKKYIDMHILLSGTEKIDTGFAKDMQEKSYNEEKDLLIMEGKKQATVILVNPGDFLVCFPNDVHRTAIAVDRQNQIKKSIFKIRLA